MSLPDCERGVQNPMIEYTIEVGWEYISSDEAQIKLARLALFTGNLR